MATQDHKSQILRHSLGLDRNGRGSRWRNYYVTGPGTDDFDACREMVTDGLMIERQGNELTGGDSIFHVTPKGMDSVWKGPALGGD